MGDLGEVQRTRSLGPDDVRPDDGRIVDLHRQPGHRPRHLRNLRRNGPPAFRRRPQGQMDLDRRPRRHGRRAAARRGDGRGALHRHRGAGQPDREAPRDPLCRPSRDQHRRSAGDHRRTRPNPRHVGLLGNAAEILPEMVARGIRPDAVTDQTQRARSRQRLLPGRLERRPVDRNARARSRRGRRRRAQVDGRPCRSDARLPENGHSDLRLWQQHPPGSLRRGRHERLRLPRLRPRLCPPLVLPRHRPVPLGRAVGRSRGHPPRPTPR